MSGLLDILIPPWADDLVVGPAWRILAAQYNAIFNTAGKLFGTGEQPQRLPPPPPPALPPATGGTGPAQDEIDKLSEQILQLQQQIATMATAAQQAATQSGANSESGNKTTEGLLSDRVAAEALDPQGSTPDAQAAALAAMQQQIDALTQNVQDKATNATGIADALRNLGSAMPAMGMPSMGMPGGGMPLGLGGLGGLGAPAVSPLNDTPPPSVTARNAEDTLQPPHVSSTAAAEQPRVTPATLEQPAAPPPPIPAVAASTPATSTPAAPPKPEVAAAATPDHGKDITLPSGQVVSAPNAAAAAAVRTALSTPAGTGDIATTAYAGTGVTIPTDGAEPGRKIDPADLQPGDIAVFGDHTALVAGNGQLVGSDGKLQPLGVINDSNNFHGFYRPTETTDTPASVTTPATAGVSATTAPGTSPTLMAAPLPGQTSSATTAKAPAPPAAAPTNHVR